MTDFWVIIPAGGSGQRFSTSVAKQYCAIGEKCVLEHTLDIFLALPWVTKIIIPLSEEDTHFSQLSLPKTEKIVPVPAGEERFFSVFNALRFLEGCAKPADWILTHDASRPCLHREDLHNLKAALEASTVGGILAKPVQDTIKEVLKGIISHTVPRQLLWQALTPQMFRMGVLWDAYKHCYANKHYVTDDAGAIEHFGLGAQVVPARYPNPKLTYAYDLPYINQLLTMKERA